MCAAYGRVLGSYWFPFVIIHLNCVLSLKWWLAAGGWRLARPGPPFPAGCSKFPALSLPTLPHRGPIITAHAISSLTDLSSPPSTLQALV